MNAPAEAATAGDESGAGALAAVLMDHPFADDQGLLFTIDREISAGEARAAARRTASQLVEAGVRPGQAVAVRLPNGPDAITAMVGIWLAGAIFVPINLRAPEPEQHKMLEATGSVAEIGPDGLRTLPYALDYPEDAAFVLWTSGTTGPPKPIIHTHHAYLELIDRILNSLRGSAPRTSDRPPMPNLIPTSLALNSGIYNSLFGLRQGASLVIMSRFDPHEFAELVRRHGIRSTVLPPAAMVALSDAPDVTDLAPLRYVRSITAPLSPLQGRRFQDKFGITVLNGYGQAEIGEVIGWTAEDARAHPEKIGAVGRPHASVDVKLVDDNGIPVSSGAIGRLLVRTKKMAAGYAEGDELTDRLDAEGFLDTGDLARVDEDGFIWIEGRASDLINRGGNKVFPDQVEEVLRLSPSVAEAAVVGVPDDRLGEVPVALIVPTSGTIDTKELERLCREHLAPYKVPVRFEVVSELVRSEVGKVLRKEMARRLRAGGPDADA